MIRTEDIHYGEQANPYKVYVDVEASLSRDGELIPKAFTWEDGHRYEIDRVRKKERCASRKAGGAGIMYTVMVKGRECHLFYEEDRFFMEKK